MLTISMNDSIKNACCDVVIVNYNAGDLLKDCIASLLYEPVRSVVIVDNNSTDLSLNSIEDIQGKERVVVLRNLKNVGFSAACNLGIKLTTAPNILFLNPDCIVDEDAIQQLISTLNSATNIGMVGGLLCNSDGSEQAGGRRVFPTPRRAFIRGFGLHFLTKNTPWLGSDYLLHLEPLPVKPILVEAISGACMMVKRQAIETVGLWDEGYFLHCEDLDWCMRFRLSGYQVMFVPNARIFHHWGACSRTRPVFVEWHKHRGMLRFYKKFFRKKYPSVLWIGVIFGVWFRFLIVATYYLARKMGKVLGVIHDE